MNGPVLLRRVGVALAIAVGIVAIGALSFCVAFRIERSSNVVTVPDWAGRTAADATEDARRLGLLLEIGEKRHDPGVAADRVLQQEPAAGSTVRRGRTVRVVLSLGGEMLTVPDLVREPSRQADLALRGLGLQPGWDARVTDDAPDGTVIAQAPAAGTLSVAGERVNRMISSGPRPVRYVMPDLAGRSLREVQDWITLCGFREGIVRRLPADGREPGTVIGQLPPAGWPVARKDVIEVTVAR